MTKSQIAAVLEEVAALLELKGENPFKIRAYTNAARSLETFGGNISNLQDEEELSKIPGIGKSIAEKIKELAATGSLKYLEELRTEFPAAILELFSISGLGAKKIKALYEQLQVSSIEQLRQACETGRVAELPGFGETTQAKICKAIEERAKHSGYFQFGQIAGEAETLRSDLVGHLDALQVDVAGSYRRRKEIVHDLDLVVATKKPEAITKFFVAHPLVESIIAQGPTKSSVRLRSGVQCDLRVVSSAEYPFALAYFTGNKEHNIELRSRALERGWTLNEYRLAPLPVDPKAKKKRPVKKIPKVRDEADLYRAVDLDFIAPELRENIGEFEAAEKHSLPKLIEQENLRGTFHCHTIASDGHNSLEEMAEAAQALGLEYLGIADHSRSSIQAHGIDEAQLRAQVAAIRELNKKFDGFRLFAGVECDILRDGSLDFPDEVLSQLDYVVVSVHSVFNLSEADMTRRVIRAMENRFVTMLAHPTGRLLLKREPYQIDIPAVLDAAARTGTWIELNAAPKRLDLDWRWWPLAKQKGVKCVINPDAHRTERLQDLWFGIGIARKGWLTKDDVVNCLPLGKIERALRAKPEGRFKA
ncbi:MAG TPA: DNA polymerase/3'-5' exonuclease PolX [Candidatus Udaeobacter sp.]|jgi:DNA polymerase (family 10)|nr:DNA polymerase/3'-5' exonuclease PolX [Candidatus Udaeobacter sp.]